MTKREERARRAFALRAEVQPFLAMDILSAARRREQAGASVVHMEIGEPGFPAPSCVGEAVAKALGGRIGYTEALGMPPLRERIAQHYRDTYGLDIPASRIAVTTGSSGGFILAFLAMFDIADRVAVASPGYPPYRTLLEALGLVAVEIETNASTRWALDAAAIERAHAQSPLAGVLVMSPANPSGTVITPDALSDIAATCRRLGIRLISDEIYHGLTYGMPVETALRFDGDAVVINSFSKYWCMTGWRVGWLVLPADLVRPVERLAQNLFISAPTLSQLGATVAFDARDELEKVRGIYARNRALLLDALPRLGFDSFLPADGAFYIYLDVAQHTNDSLAFAMAMLEGAGVAATPGVDFDRARGHHYLRLSFAGPEADMHEALERLSGWLPSR